MNILNLTGKAAIVTGAGQGVGQSIARHLAAYGARVVVNDYIGERAEAVAAALCDEFGPGTAIGVAADVTDYLAVSKMIETSVEAFGQVDILINNAGNAGADPGKLTGKPFWDQDPGEWDAWIGVNFRGVLNTVRAVLPAMIERRTGSLITIISDAGRVGEPRLEVYSGAKAGAAGFMRGIARSVGRFQIRANCVAISTTRTPATEAFFAEGDNLKQAMAKYVIRRPGEPDDISGTVLLLASDAAAWTTGQTYPVNGGFDFAV